MKYLVIILFLLDVNVVKAQSNLGLEKLYNGDTKILSKYGNDFIDNETANLVSNLNTLVRQEIKVKFYIDSVPGFLLDSKSNTVYISKDSATTATGDSINLPIFLFIITHAINHLNEEVGIQQCDNLEYKYDYLTGFLLNKLGVIKDDLSLTRVISQDLFKKYFMTHNNQDIRQKKMSLQLGMKDFSVELSSAKTKWSEYNQATLKDSINSNELIFTCKFDDNPELYLVYPDLVYSKKGQSFEPVAKVLNHNQDWYYFLELQFNETNKNIYVHPSSRVYNTFGTIIGKLMEN